MKELTDLQVEVIELIGKNWNYEGIAEKMGLSEPAVRSHMRNILNKAERKTRDAAIRRMSETRIVEGNRKLIRALTRKGSMRIINEQSYFCVKKEDWREIADEVMKDVLR